MRVRDIMTSPVVVVSPDDGLKDVASLLERRGVAAVPVVADGRLQGIVSKTDIVRREQAFELQRRGRGVLGRLRGRAPAEHVETARQLMTSPTVTVGPSSSAVGAAWLMTEHDVHHLPVVDRGRVVGIVSRSDLVRAFARSDEQIRREIVDEVLPSLDVSPNDVTVSVSDGEVELSGDVCDELAARCVPHAVRAVIGVVDVRCTLRPAHREHVVDVVTPTL